MDQTELEKCRNDVVYFAEKYLGAELKPWQKAYLKLINKYKYVYFAGNGNGEMMLDDILNKHKEMFQ